MSAATSLRTRRNSCGSVRWSRRRVRLCCTSGCVMTVTPFTSVQEVRREKIHATGLKSRQVEAQVHLQSPALGLPKQAEQLGEIVVLAVLDQIGLPLHPAKL